jgi:hypothetical protein
MLAEYAMKPTSSFKLLVLIVLYDSLEDGTESETPYRRKVDIVGDVFFPLRHVQHVEPLGLAVFDIGGALPTSSSISCWSYINMDGVRNVRATSFRPLR